MKLEWFREHQSKFFLITAILVIPGMMIFGSFDPFQRGSGSGRGPWGEYWLPKSGKHIKVSPEQIVQYRSLDGRFQQGGPPGSKPALESRVRRDVALDLGVDVGPEELIAVIRNELKQRTGEEKITKDLHKRVLDRHDLSEVDYERLNYERALVGKAIQIFQKQAKVAENGLYVSYCQDNQKVRLWYRAFRSQDFEAEVDKPTQEEIKKYFEKNKDKEAKTEGALYQEPRLSADVFYIQAKDVEVKLEPDENAMKAFYSQNKEKFWKAEGWDAKKPVFKPLEEVKEDLVKRYVQKELERQYDLSKAFLGGKKLEDCRDKVIEEYKKNHRHGAAFKLFSKYSKELETAMKAAEKEKKPFDLKAFEQFAKERKLKFWRTKKGTKKAFLDGTDKLEAPDFMNARNLFFTAEREASAGVLPSGFKLQPVRPYHQMKEDEGYVAQRIATFEKERPMTLEEATPVITQRLIEEKAVEKAQEAAKALAKKWKEGKDLPKHADVVDETFKKGDLKPNALASAYFSAPKPLGEVLEAAAEKDPAVKDAKSGRKRVLVGFAVERMLPSFKDFEQDFSAKATQRRKFQQYFRRNSLGQGAYNALKSWAKPSLADVPDPQI